MAPSFYPRPARQYGLDTQTQNMLVEKRLSEFTWNNPLGVSPYMHFFVAVYLPSLVSLGIGMNIFAAWVLESTFIRDLVIQPLLTLLLRLNSLLLMCGPFYVWLVQSCGLYITGDQIFHCFLLNLAHNFSLLSSAFILVAIVIERGLAIGRPKTIWSTWRKICTNLGTILLHASVLLSLGELLHLDAQTIATHKNYPLCLPWWENEYGTPKWYKLMAVFFSLGPTLTIAVFILLLELCTAKFSLMSKLEQDSLTDYQALLVELTNTVHFKFSNSASCLGIVFIILCSPVGLFITLGPILHVKGSWVTTSYGEMSLSTDINSTFLAELDPGNQLLDNDTLNINDAIHSQIRDLFTTEEPSPVRTTAVVARRIKLLSPLEYRYTLISRSDAETVIWLMRYTFCLLAVPILLTTEVLFVREWKGRFGEITNCLLFWRNRKNSKWASTEDAPWKVDMTKRARDFSLRQSCMAGPYIARMEDDHLDGDDDVSDDSVKLREKRREKAGRAIKSNRKVKEMKVFDASKPACAGWNVQKLGIKQRRKSMRKPIRADQETGKNWPFFQTIQNTIARVFTGTRTSEGVDLNNWPRRAQAQNGFKGPSSGIDYFESPPTTDEKTGTDAAAPPSSAAGVTRGATRHSRSTSNPPKGEHVRAQPAIWLTDVTADTRDYQLLAQLAAARVQRHDFINKSNPNTFGAEPNVPTKIGNVPPASVRSSDQKTLFITPETPQPQAKADTRKSPKATNAAGMSQNVV